MISKEMVMGSENSSMELLSNLLITFSQTALECVNDFFSIQSVILMPFEVVDQLQSKFDFILTIGSSNENYSALMIVGIQRESLCAFTGRVGISYDEAADILGEFTNNFSGMISDEQPFTDRFGILSQAVPILYTEGQSYLSNTCGIQGYVYLQAHWIYIGYTIRERSRQIQ